MLVLVTNTLVEFNVDLENEMAEEKLKFILAPEAIRMRLIARDCPSIRAPECSLFKC